jgi:hypothetical protein
MMVSRLIADSRTRARCASRFTGSKTDAGAGSTPEACPNGSWLQRVPGLLGSKHLFSFVTYSRYLDQPPIERPRMRLCQSLRGSERVHPPLMAILLRAQSISDAGQYRSNA